MGRREITRPENVEAEIQRLKESEYVKLAQLEQCLKADKRRKWLHQLRWYEKHGRMLADMGITRENMQDYVDGMMDDAEDADGAESVV